MKAQLVVRVAVCVAVLLVARSARSEFGFPDFGSTSGLSLNGDAAQVGNVLRVTRGASRVEDAGSVWYVQKQRLIGGFDTTFVFNINGLGGLGPGADGLAFVVQDSPDGLLASGGFGSGLGYWTMKRSLAVEFDTWTWGPPGEAAVDHISVQTRGAEGNSNEDKYAIPPAPLVLPFELNDGMDHSARVRYVPGSMEVYVDDLSTPRLVVPLDLTNIDGERILDAQGEAWVGFTAATGAGYQNHDLVAWQFHVVPEPASLTLLTLGILVLLLRRMHRRLG